MSGSLKESRKEDRDEEEYADIIKNIVSGAPIRMKKVTYTGYASSIYSVENAVEILDYISEKTDSEDVLPFAIRLVEHGAVVQIAEDNGEIACGELLSTLLNGYEGYNVLVCVSRKVEGCYVSEMIQNFKLRVIKEAAISALDNIFLTFNPKATAREKKEKHVRLVEEKMPTQRLFGPDNYVVSKKVHTLKKEIEKSRVSIDPFNAPNGSEKTKKLKLAHYRGKLIKLSEKLATSKLA